MMKPLNITTYKKMTIILSVVCIYLLTHVIYLKIEYRNLWFNCSDSNYLESIQNKKQKKNIKADLKIINDSIEISVCDINKSLLDSPEINKVLITPMFLNADIVIPFIRIKVNEKEKKYLLDPKHGLNSVKGALCVAGAWEGIIGTSKDGYYNNQPDALRHAFWAACMTALISPSEAQEILDNHENGSSDVMDTYNNKKGIEIGKALKNANPSGVTNEQIWNAVKSAFDKGELYCAKCNPPIIPGVKSQPTPTPTPQPKQPKQPKQSPDNRPDRPDPTDHGNSGDKSATEQKKEARQVDPMRDVMPRDIDKVPSGPDREISLPPSRGPQGFISDKNSTPNVYLIGALSFIAGIIIMWVVRKIGKKS